MNYQPVLYHANLVENLWFVCWVLVSEFTQEYTENISRYSCGTLEKILGIVLRKFPGMGSEELLAGNSKKFPQMLSPFSAVLVTRNSLELVTRNSLDRVMRIS